MSKKAVRYETIKNYEKVSLLNAKISEPLFETKIKKLKEELVILQADFDKKIVKFDEIQVAYLNLSNDFISEISKKYKFKFDVDIKNNYINNINSMFYELKIKERLENESEVLIKGR